MPVKIVGRETVYWGKPLLRMLIKLKDFGVGRMCYRYSLMKAYGHKNPNYFIITKAFPDFKDSLCEDERTLGEAFGYEYFDGYFRGHNEIEDRHLADWRLVPKGQEIEFARLKNPLQVYAKEYDPVPMPPLMAILETREAERKNQPVGDLFVTPRPLEDNASAVEKAAEEARRAGFDPYDTAAMLALAKRNNAAALFEHMDAIKYKQY